MTSNGDLDSTNLQSAMHGANMASNGDLELCKFAEFHARSEHDQ